MKLHGGNESNNRRKDNDAVAGLTSCAVSEDSSVRDPRTIQLERTLLEVIRTEEPKATKVYKSSINHNNRKKNWKKFKDRLRLKRAGEAFSPSIFVPVSVVLGPLQDNNSSSCEDEQISTGKPKMEKDYSFDNLAVVFDDRNGDPDVESFQTSSNNSNAAQRRQLSRLESTRDSTTPENSDDEPRTLQGSRSIMQRKPSSRLVRTESVRSSAAYDPELDPVPISDIPPAQSNRTHMLRRDSSRISPLAVRDEMNKSSRLSEALAAEREQIQRVVSSSTGSTAEDEEQYQEAEEETGNTEQPVKMSLMDLLGEDMGEDEEEEDEETEQVVCSSVVEYEYTCCVCMVKHTGNAFIPCGHTFCRLCSRELYVSKGNCPLCNGFILEILDIF